MAAILFEVNGTTVEIAANDGENLLDVARKANVAIDAPCSGNGVCGKCRVRLLEGTLDSPENRHLTREEYEAGWRLACCAKVVGDARIEVPDIASAYRSRMKMADLSSPEEVAIFLNAEKQLADAGMLPGSDLRFLTVRLSEPTVDDAMPDNERLMRAIRAQTGCERVELSFRALQRLAETLRGSGFCIKCVVSARPETLRVLDVLPEDSAAPLAGIALDLGTTSLAALLVNLETGAILAKGSGGNGQIRFGADVINRMIESSRPGGRKRLQDAVIVESIRPLIEELCATAGVPQENVYRMVLAGNTTMNHLLLGLFADPIRMEPFVPSFFQTKGLLARDIGLPLHPEAELVLAPNIGSYVGGDITAGTLSSMIWNRPELSLFIDLGTNGELVLGNNEFLMSCACSAGPAFEGGDISCGMRATDGAIEACTIDPVTLEPTLTVVGGCAPAGICGSGIIDIIAELFRAGAINGKGKLVREGDRILHDEHGMGSYVLAWQSETGGVKDVAINEVDIDNFIRAKGAIYSATATMLAALDMDASMIERVYVAGGIGSGINMKNAVTIGMFPDIPIGQFSYIGNSSLTGAYAMLLSSLAQEKVEELGSSITYLELSNVPGYMDAFVAACFLPHTDASLFPSVCV